MKINNLNSLKPTFFKNSMTKKEFHEIRNQKLLDSYKEDDKIGAMSAIAGLGIGTIAKLKNMKNPFEKGAYGYFITLFTLYGLSAIKSFFNKEEVDLGSEEKNKEYKRLEKENAEESLKYIYAPALITSALSTIITATVCIAKNVPNKIDKIKIAPLLTVMPTLLVSSAILGIKNLKENKKTQVN